MIFQGSTARVTFSDSPRNRVAVYGDEVGGKPGEVVVLAGPSCGLLMGNHEQIVDLHVLCLGACLTCEEGRNNALTCGPLPAMVNALVMSALQVTGVHKLVTLDFLTGAGNVAGRRWRLSGAGVFDLGVEKAGRHFWGKTPTIPVAVFWASLESPGQWWFSWAAHRFPLPGTFAVTCTDPRNRLSLRLWRPERPHPHAEYPTVSSPARDPTGRRCGTVSVSSSSSPGSRNWIRECAASVCVSRRHSRSALVVSSSPKSRDASTFTGRCSPRSRAIHAAPPVSHGVAVWLPVSGFVQWVNSHSSRVVGWAVTGTASVDCGCVVM